MISCDNTARNNPDKKKPYATPEKSETVMETGIFLCVIPLQPQHTTTVRTSEFTVCFSVTHECDWSERVNVRRSERGEREGKQLWAELGVSEENRKEKSY